MILVCVCLYFAHNRAIRLCHPSHSVPLCVCLCVLSSHWFWTPDLWTHQLGSHRRKFTQDLSTSLLRCLPYFLSREGFRHLFPSSTLKSNFVYPRIVRSPLVGRVFLFEPTSQRQKVSRLPTEPPGRATSSKSTVAQCEITCQCTKSTRTLLCNYK